MPVKILILSGARQGEQLVLDEKEFRAGSDPGCKVFFNAERDRAIQGRSAMFQLDEDGWYIRCTGGEVLLNQQAVAGRTRVRSGDVVRMSESGPDFSFSIVANVSASPIERSACENGLPLSSEPVLERSGGFPVQSVVDGGPRAEMPDVSCGVAEVKTTSVPPAAGKIDRRWVIWAAGGLALGSLAWVVARSVLSPPTIVVNVSRPDVPLERGVATTGADARIAGRENAKTGQTNKPETKKNPDKGAPFGEEKGQSAGVGKELADAVFLLQVEKAGQAWPFATCVAIGNDTLLTTGREAAQLATWQEEKGFKIWVTRPATGFKEEVQDIRINGVFASLADKPNGWIYFNMGLLVVRGKLPKVAPLAAPEELAKLEEGSSVSCFGFTHEGEKITRFDRFEPRLTSGKVYVITPSPDLPARSILLHVKAEIPVHAYGSPVVNAQGKVVGIYGEVAAPPPGKGAASSGAGLKNMHYITVLNPDMLNLWLRNRDAKMWPAAAAIRTIQKPHGDP